MTTGYLVCISDRDHIIAACGLGKKEYEKQAVSKELEEILERRKTFLAHKGEKDFFPVTESDPQEYESLAVATIIAHGDAIGSVVMFSRVISCRNRKSRWW